MGGKLRGDFIRLFFYLIDLVVLNLFVDNGTFYVLLILAKYPWLYVNGNKMSFRRKFDMKIM